MWRKTDDIAARFPQAAYSLTVASERHAQIVGAMRRVCYANCVTPTRMIVVQVKR
jgi:hypothetical protein